MVLLSVVDQPTEEPSEAFDETMRASDAADETDAGTSAAIEEACDDTELTDAGTIAAARDEAWDEPKSAIDAIEDACDPAACAVEVAEEVAAAWDFRAPFESNVWNPESSV